MPSKARRIPSYRLHKPSGQARVIIDGKQHYLGRYGTPDSHLRYDELIAELVTGQAEAGGPKITLTELLAKFWKHAKRRYSKHGKGPFGNAVNWRPIIRLLRERHGSESPERFGPLAFRELIADMLARDWSRQYTNMQIARVKRIYKWAASLELVSESAYRKLATVEGVRIGEMDFREAKPIEPVDDDVVERTLPFMADRVAVMVQVQRLTGARPGEIVIMRPMDIDRSRDDVWVYTPHSHKTQHRGKSRRIILGPKAQQVLAKYLLRAEDQWCFIGRRGTRYNPDTYRRHVERSCDKGGIPRWTPGQLRHSAATAARETFDIESASAMLGHSGVKITEVYAERSEQRAIEVAKRLG